MKIWKIFIFCFLLDLSYQKSNKKHKLQQPRKLPGNDNQLSMQMLNQLINALQGNQNSTNTPQPTVQHMQVQQAIAQQRMQQIQHRPLTNQTSINHQVQHQQLTQAQMVHQPMQVQNKGKLSENDFFSNEDLQNMNHGLQPVQIHNLKNTVHTLPQQHVVVQHQKIQQHQKIVSTPSPLQLQLKKQEHDIENLHHQIKHLEEKISHKEENINKLKEELEEQKKHFKESENNFTKGSEEIKKLHEEIKNLNEEKEKLIKEHQEKEEELQKKLTEAEQKNQTDLERIQKLQEDLESQQQKLDAQEDNQEGLQEQLDRANEVKEQERQDIQHYASQVQELKTQIQQIEEEKKQIEERTNNMQQIAEQAVKVVYDQKLSDYKKQAKQQIDNMTQSLDAFNALAPQEHQNQQRTKEFIGKIDDLISESQKDIQQTYQHLPQEHTFMTGTDQDLEGQPDDQVDINKIDRLMAKLDDPEVQASDYQNQQLDEHHLPADQMDHVEKQIESLTEMLGNLSDDRKKERVLYQKLPQRNLQVQPRKIIQNFRQPQNQKHARKMVLKRMPKKYKNFDQRRIRKVKLIYDRHHRLLRKIPLEKYHYAKQEKISQKDQKQIKKYKKIIQVFKKDKLNYIQII